MAGTQFKVTNLEYLILGLKREDGKLKTSTLPKEITQVTLDFYRDGDKWVLKNHDKAIGMIGTGMLDGILFPVNETREK